MGLVVGVVNQKGGCAKSTSAVHLAYWISVKKNQRALLVDADTQCSSSIWLKSLLKVNLPYKVIQSSDDLLEQIPKLAQEWDYVIVDGPAGLSEPTRAILFRSDIAVVPCQPTGVDLQSASAAIRLIKQAQSVRNGPPSAALFLSRAVKGTNLKNEATSVLTKVPGVLFLKSVIHQRQVVADTFGQNATVWQMPGRSAAESAREFENLFREVIQYVK